MMLFQFRKIISFHLAIWPLTLILFLSLFSSFSSFSSLFFTSAHSATFFPTTMAPAPLQEKIQQKIYRGEIYANSNVQSKKQRQSLNFLAAGLQPITCQQGLRFINRYEEFPKHIEAVKKVRYQENSQLLWMNIDSSFFPHPLLLEFAIPRIEKVGQYPFTFKKGPFKDLQGQILVQEQGVKCLYVISAQWEGPASGFPDTVLEIFAETLISRGMEKMFRLGRI